MNSDSFDYHKPGVRIMPIENKKTAEGMNAKSR